MYRWEVEPEHRGESFPQWVERVDRVVRLTLTLEQPNPHFRRESVEELVNGMKARMLRLQAESPEGLDINDDFIQDALDHAAEYGSYTATAEVSAQGRKKKDTYNSERQGSAKRTEVPVDPQTREVRAADLQRALREDLPTDDLKGESKDG
jgi:hypothetical protein